MHVYLIGPRVQSIDGIKKDHMLTPSVCPPRPSMEYSRPVVEGLCGPDLNRGIGMDFNHVGGIYNEVHTHLSAYLSWPETLSSLALPHTDILADISWLLR